MSVRVGSQTFSKIVPGADSSTDQALADARALKKSGHNFVAAQVHRFDGLVLLEGFDTSATGHHFRTPLCGYEGTGPRTTVEILEMFGFGNEITLYNQVRHGFMHTFTR